MKITIATPKRPSSGSGNDVTSTRWAKRLTEIGHEVTLAMVIEGQDVTVDVAIGSDVLVALHAKRCGSAVAASRDHAPERPVIVGLAGTDLYSDIPANNLVARASIDTADRLVVLQEAAIGRLAAVSSSLADKAHVVFQSVDPPIPARRESQDHFVVLVLAHLRDVKDPLLAAEAARLVPQDSRIRVVHGGHASNDEWHSRATSENASNPRYEWLGELDNDSAKTQLSQASVLACTSLLEGGANVVSEAIALGVPVVGTDIDGNSGLLGSGYPGLVPVGDAPALARWLLRLENEPEVLSDLTGRIRDRRVITDPATERDGWQAVLDGL